MKLFEKIRSTALACDTRGLSTVEYVIILCLIAAVAVGVWQTFGETVRNRLDAASGEIGGTLPESY
jgi:Flp pilus assembly pilin Flp